MNISLLILYFLNFCVGIVYNINDDEYRRMPRLYDMDDYDSCVQDINGLYCVAQFELYAKYENELIDFIKEYSKDTMRHFNHSIIERGICVSISCKEYISNRNKTTEDLRATLEECFNEIIWKEYKINAKLSYLYNCDRHDDQKVFQIDTLDWLFAGLIVLLVLITLTGSFYDVICNKNQGHKSAGNKYLLCFSVFQNFRSLIPRQPEDPRLQRLVGLHAIRTISLAFTVYSHFLLLLPTFNKDPLTFEKAYDKPFHHLLFDGMMIVQIFFFLSGFLSTYLLQIHTEKKTVGWSLAPKVIILRWWRLTPVSAVIIGFLATWMRHLGSGPLWLATTNGPTADCRNYWWSHILYINNMGMDNKRCLFQFWHMAADTQMLILGVIVHVATRNGGRVMAFSLLLILGMLAPAIHVWLYDSEAVMLVTPQYLRTLSSDTFFNMHNRSYMNLPSFILGMSTAYIGYNLQKKGVDLSSNKVLRFLSWWFIPLIIAIIFSGSIFFCAEMRASVLARMAYAATHRAVIGLVCSAMTLGLICKCNDLSRTLFEWRFWIVTSKLSYCVSIIHTVFIYILIGYRRELFPVSFAAVGFITFRMLVLSYIAAVPLYLIVEAPFSRLITVLLERKVKKKTA